MCMGKTPKPPPPPPPPEPIPASPRLMDEQVVQARTDQQRRIRATKGSTASLLASRTGGLTETALGQQTTIIGR